MIHMNKSVPVLLSFLSAVLTVAQAAKSDDITTTKRQVMREFSRLPLMFQATQTDPRAGAAFLSQGPGYSLLLKPDEALLVTGKEKRQAIPMKLAGANRMAQGRGVNPTSSQTYYFIGSDPGKWRSKVPSYQQVRYENVYRGIDLIYYGNQGQLEYDLIVSPGADPTQIRLRFPEAHRIRIDAGSGDLHLDSAAGEVRLHKPVAYQDAPRQSVEARYTLSAGKQVSIEVSGYDSTRPLVIDPVLTLDYSTYLGGSGTEEGVGVAVDSAGNAYVTGITNGGSFPLSNSLPAPNNAFGGGSSDVFVSKLVFDKSTSHLSLAWSTFLGGAGEDWSSAIAVDASGGVYVTGFTSSLNFPLANPIPARGGVFQGGFGDAFVTKLSFNDSTSTLRLAYSTYLGGNDYDYARAITVDSGGNAYVTGESSSNDFPLVSPLGAPNSQQGAVFITKLAFNNGALSVPWSTKLGGTLESRGIAVDPSGDIFVTGNTRSANFPVVNPLPAPNNALQGPQDAFVTRLRFNSAASALSFVYSTFLGGSGQPAGGLASYTGYDFAKGIAVDSLGNAYVSGQTFTTDFPVVNPLPGGVSTGSILGSGFIS
jgi:hypothetical protein